MHRPKESQKSLLESTMSPPTDFKDTNPNFPAEQSSNVCPTWLRRLCLGLAALHLLGVLAEPLRFFSRSELGVAPDFGWLGETAKPYSQWLYLDHGYFFFAPNPGPGHLIRCSLSRKKDVEHTESDAADSTRFFPDRKSDWPRLLYHRYFMLSEFYNSRYAPRQVTEELKKDPEFLARWTFDNDLYLQIQTSMTKSLKHSTGATQVDLRRLERLLPDPPQILREGLALTDPRFLVLLPESMIEPIPKAPDPSAKSELVPLPSRSNIEVKP